MTGASEIVAALARARLIAVIRTPDAAALPPLVEALVEGGIRAVEITMTVPNALAAVADTARRMPADGVLGVGTVLDAAVAARAVDSGARFVVSPVLALDIVDAAHARGAAAVPAGFSPTEIWTAWRSGAQAVKVFPATSLGPAYVKDLRGPLPDVRLIPTGGVTRDNAADWLRAGALAVGVGTALVEAAAVARGDWAAVRARARAFVDAVAGAAA